MIDNLKYSSELMENFIHGRVMDPRHKFEALQTRNGYSLFFSISSEGVFHVTEEVHNKLDAKETQLTQIVSGIDGHHYKTGWKEIDLSAKQIFKDFPNKIDDVTCKTFDVNQNIVTNTIGATMVLNDKKTDHLYLCIGNSDLNMEWLLKPEWKAFPFDNPESDQKVGGIKIVNVFISEAEDKQYIIVDLERKSSASHKMVERFYINTEKEEGYAWEKHDVEIDLEVDHYQSCLGRADDDSDIDGTYTVGHVGNSNQLIYKPLENPFGEGEADVSRFELPEKVLIDTFAVARNESHTSDLFCVGNDKVLYYFAPDNQEDFAEGVKLFKHDLFVGVEKLYAHQSEKLLVVWGLNQAKEVFYTSCNLSSDIVDSGNWTNPIVILSNAELISPYINRVNDGNTFFAVSDDKLFKLMKSPETTIWKNQQIILPPHKKNAPAHHIKSYTTHIELKDENTNPLGEVELMISSNTRGHFYINNLYYVLDQNPIHIKTDALGSITIIEAIDNLNGSKIMVSKNGGKTITINPMNKSVNKLTKLDSADSLQKAQIKDHHGNTESFIPKGQDKALLAAAASMIKNTGEAHSDVEDANVEERFVSMNLSVGSDLVLHRNGSILTDFGDLYNLLKSVGSHILHNIEKVAEGVWHFVVEIGGKFYHAILDCVEKIAGALKWIYKQIEAGIEKLLKFLKFLFEWGDVTRTKEAFKHVSLLYMNYGVEQLDSAKHYMDDKMDDLVKKVSDLSGVNWKKLGEHGTKKIGKNSKRDENHQDKNSAGNNLLMYHLQHNASNSTCETNDPSEEHKSFITILIDALEAEKETMNEVYCQLNLLTNKFKGKSLKDIPIVEILKEIGGILTCGAIETVKNLLDAIFELLKKLVYTVKEFLSAPLYIPIVSDFLSLMGVELPSIIDIFCWIAAVPATVIYKLVKGAAPFPKNGTVTNEVMNAKHLSELMPQRVQQENEMFLRSNNKKMSSSARSAIYTSFQSGGAILNFCCALIKTSEALIPDKKNPFSGISLGLSIGAAALPGIAGMVCPHNSFHNSGLGVVRGVYTVFSIIVSVVVSVGKAPRAVSSVISSLMTVPKLILTVLHFIELGGDKNTPDRSIAICSEIGSSSGYISGVAYAVTVAPKSPVTPFAAATLAGSFIITGGLNVATGLMEGMK
ncbi:MAG: hypothetical protein ACRBFS_13940 [Aureispira sp.]